MDVLAYAAQSPVHSTMRRDITTAYLVTAARIVGWIVISATVYRRLGPAAFAILTLVRSTVGLLGNSSLGLTPAMISELAKASRKPATRESQSARAVYSNGMALAGMLGLVGCLLSFLYGQFFTLLHRVPAEFSPSQMFVMAFFMGAGIVARMISDVPAAVLQTRSHIALDNLLVAGSEILWVAVGSVALIMGRPLEWVGISYFIANGGLIAARFAFGVRLASRPKWALVNRAALASLLAFGAMVAVAELSDFLYAPMDYILINRLLNPVDVAMYAPAIQIDGALLLLVTAVADVLLPKAALAHHAGDAHLVRKYYLIGTLGTAGLLIAASLGAWAAAPIIFKFWLGQKLYSTRAILPLILIHTVISGSSAVGRSILLGMGKVKPFTIAVVLAAVVNVILSYVFVRYCGMGLPGIVLGTIVAVVGRCGIWMPWYVMRQLDRNVHHEGTKSRRRD